MVLAWAGLLSAAPSYTVAGIVNAIDYSAGPFAPNSIVSIYGTGLSLVDSAAQSSVSELPVEIGYTRVYVDHVQAPMLYVSPGQINFLIPENQMVGDTIVQVVSAGVAGPEVTIHVKDTAPILIPAGNSYIAATHSNGSMITPDQPARGGEIIVLYLVGMGKVSPFFSPTLVPNGAAWITHLSDLQVLVAGAVLDPNRVIYAGVTPFFAGLYQINFALPDQPGTDPEIRVSDAGQVSATGTKLALR
jgi:uncharacterized protein (TIGR03437 family)